MLKRHLPLIFLIQIFFIFSCSNINNDLLELQEQNNILKDEIESVMEKNNQIKKDLEENINLNEEYRIKMNEEISKLSSENERMNKDINILKKKNEEWQGVKYIFLSDSYDDLAEATGWITPCAKELGLEKEQYVNLSKSGGSFLANTWYDQLDNYRKSISTEEASKITAIIFSGGINDCMSDGLYVAEWLGTVDYFLSTLKSKIIELNDFILKEFPNAFFYYGFSGFAWEDSPVLYGRSYKAREYSLTHIKSFMNELESSRYKVLKNTEFCLHHSTLLYTDRLHPNQDGQFVIAKTMRDAFLTGSASITYVNSSCILESDICNINTFSMTEKLNNEIIQIEMFLALENFNKDISDEWIKIGFIDSKIIQHTNPFIISIKAIDENSSKVNTFGMLKIENRVIYIKSANSDINKPKSLIIDNVQQILRTMES